jgi:hypothetical protein
MLKNISIIILLMAFAAQSFNRVMIVFNYYGNTASFAKNCENKAKPMLHCNGRCQMMKKLKQEENKDKQNPQRRNENKDEVYCVKNILSFTQAKPSFPSPEYLTRNNTATKDIASEFFHPPGAYY